MKIRQAILEDANALADFNIKMAYETEAIKLKPEVITAGVKKMIENPAMGFYLVVEVDNVIQASLMVTTEWSDWRNGLFWWIQSVYVQPDYRRKGLYSAMYNQVRKLSLSQANVCGYRLYVERDNINAKKTYQSLGMHETEYFLYEEMKEGIEYRDN
jgi:ribosomal protein S18 acetylase RimI-like enzyme